MAFPENQVEGGSSTFADDGTASHHWGALCLSNGLDPKMCGEDINAEDFLGETQTINGKPYTMDETRASFVQQYIDDVRRRAIGGSLFVEYKIDLSDLLGEDQGGTGDAIIFAPKNNLVCEDLKYGTAEKVFAKYDGEINYQLGLYLIGALKDAELMGRKIKTVTGVISQPRLGHVDEHTIPVAELQLLAKKATDAVRIAGIAMIGTETERLAYLNPGEKQCRWCRAKANCPALAKYVADQVRADFETIFAEPPVAPRDTNKLALAHVAVPLIEQWCKAVKAEVWKLVSGGTPVRGPDGLPYKIVDGKQGKRAWTDKAAAEAALLGQLPHDKVYEPREIITAPAAAKLLDKKKTEALWTDLFKPLIKNAAGQLSLVPGSDPRPPASNAAGAGEFEDESDDLTQ